MKSLNMPKKYLSVHSIVFMLQLVCPRLIRRKMPKIRFIIGCVEKHALQPNV